MKFLKIILSRAAIISVLMLLQIAFFVAVIWNFHVYYWYFYIVLIILQIIIYIKINNKDIHPAQQILWISLLMVIPIVGLSLYLLFGENRYSSKNKKRFIKINDKRNKYLTQRQQDVEHAYLGQSNFIFNTLKYPCYNNTKTQYFAQGETFFESLKIDLQNAKKFIFLEFYIIDRGALWDEIYAILKQKIAQGVEVKLIYDDLGTIYKIPSNFYKKLNKEGFDCIPFNRYYPFLTVLHNNRDHCKIMIIDGKVAYTGGVNLADEYVNRKKKMKFHWKDGGMRMEGDAAESLTISFLTIYESYNKKPNYSKYLSKENESEFSDGVVQPFVTGPKPFYKENYALYIYLNLINEAKKSIYITTPYLIPDFQLANALTSAVKRGVDVRIVVPGSPDKKIIYLMTKTNCLKLMEDGIKVYTVPGTFVHTKSILADGNVGIIGTMNFDYRSFIHNFECGVWQTQTKALQELGEDYDNMFKLPPATKKDFKINFFTRSLANIMKVLSPLF